MKKYKFAAFLTVFAIRLAVPTRLAAQEDVPDVSYFYDQLAPYGQWVDLPQYGNCFVPSNEPSGWSPYTVGHWVYSDDYGWVWVSDSDYDRNWEWACYHYGRWAYNDDVGWFWAPDTTWGPAWVGWCEDDGYVGWCPLTPAASVVGEIPFERLRLDPHRWRFVSQAHFLEPRLDRHIVDRERTASLLRNAKDITRYDKTGRGFVNRGIDVQRIREATNRPVPRYKVERVTTRPGSRSVNVEAGRVAIYHPPVAANRTGNNVARPESRTEPQRNRVQNTRPEAPRPSVSRPDVTRSREQNERQVQQQQQQTRERQQMENRALQEQQTRQREENSRAVEEQQARERADIARRNFREEPRTTEPYMPHRPANNDSQRSVQPARPTRPEPAARPAEPVERSSRPEPARGAVAPAPVPSGRGNVEGGGARGEVGLGGRR